MKSNLNRVSAFIIAAVGIVLCAYQFFDPFLWFDESGQLYIGLGLSHYADPFSARGVFRDVFGSNRNFNLDPGGFSVLVWFWTYVSTSVYFLRLLPFLFFAASVFFLYKVLEQAGIGKGYTTFFMGVYLVFASILYLMTEFRAYSMELCGTLLTLWLFLKYSDRFDYRRLLTLSLVACFFCTSRYSFILTAFVLTLLVLFTLFRKESFRTFLAKSFVFGLPLAMTVVLVYLFMMRMQDASGTMEYVGFIGKRVSLLWSPLSFLFYLNVVLSVVWYRRHGKVPVIPVYALCVSLFFFALSVFSLFPWDFKRAVSVTLLNILSLMVYIDGFAKGFDRKGWVVCAMDAAVVAGALIPILFMGLKGEAEGREFEALDLSGYARVFVNYDCQPDVRYQYEFGRLRERAAADGYPDKFVFQVEQTRADDGSFDLRVLDPLDVDCDLYYHLSKPVDEAFTLLGDCRYFYRKTVGD